MLIFWWTLATCDAHPSWEGFGYIVTRRLNLVDAVLLAGAADAGTLRGEEIELVLVLNEVKIIVTGALSGLLALALGASRGGLLGSGRGGSIIFGLAIGGAGAGVHSLLDVCKLQAGVVERVLGRFFVLEAENIVVRLPVNGAGDVLLFTGALVLHSLVK